MPDKDNNSLADLKSVFLDNMSHELRTPVTVILGYAGILFEELKDPELKEMAEIILKSSNRLTEALNLILDEADIETNRLKINLEKKNISEIVKNTAMIYKQEANSKHIDFNILIDSGNLNAFTDERMLTRIIHNLLNNAFKFTNEGEITIRLSHKNDSGKKYFVIEVTDTGIGIPKESQVLIFEAFRQVSEGMNRMYQGIGLGLSITKKFVELLKGKIELDSAEGKGTKFKIEFPLIENSTNG